MNFLELVKIRRSVRNFSDKDIPKDALNRSLEAARLAPSACNSQPWTFIVVDGEKKNKLVNESLSGVHKFNKFVEKAPVIIVIVTEGSNYAASLGGVFKNIRYSLIDIGMSGDHFALQAASEGLGTCFIGWFDEKKVKTILEIPRRKRVNLMIAVGYPKEQNIVDKKRKSFSDMVRHNCYVSKT